MNFKNEFPKQEITIVKEKCNLSKTNNECEIHYRDYKGYLDKVVHYVLKGDYNAWINGVKANFKYDTLMNDVKDLYTDEFNRSLKVYEL